MPAKDAKIGKHREAILHARLDSLFALLAFLGPPLNGERRTVNPERRTSPRNPAILRGATRELPLPSLWPAWRTPEDHQ
jgi:hypothetical protein